MLDTAYAPIFDSDFPVTKYCVVCKLHLPVSKFYTSENNEMSWCKDCRIKYQNMKGERYREENE